jgi:hypothetical protein
MAAFYMLLDETAATELAAAGATILRGSANEPYIAVTFPDNYMTPLTDFINRNNAPLSLLPTIK